MMVAAVLCLGAAVAIGISGTWLLTRPRSADPVHRILRSIAPTQFAAATMLAAGGIVALASSSTSAHTGLLVVLVCILGAVGTVATGCWQGAKAASVLGNSDAPASGACGGACAGCTLSCD